MAALYRREVPVGAGSTRSSLLLLYWSKRLAAKLVPSKTSTVTAGRPEGERGSGLRKRLLPSESVTIASVAQGAV
jgi:hypothetical protein